MFTYNPFTFALAAAWDEFSSDRAHAFYADTARAHARRAVDDSIITVTYAVYGIATVAQFVYSLGATVGAAHYDAVADHCAPKALPAAPTPKALPPARPALAPAPRRTNTVAPIAAIGSPILCYGEAFADVPDYDLAVMAKEVERSIARYMREHKSTLAKQCKALNLQATGTKLALATRLANI